MWPISRLAMCILPYLHTVAAYYEAYIELGDHLPGLLQGMNFTHISYLVLSAWGGDMSRNYLSYNVFDTPLAHKGIWQRCCIVWHTGLDGGGPDIFYDPSLEKPPVPSVVFKFD